jgi:hypothetical protein
VIDSIVEARKRQVARSGGAKPPAPRSAMALARSQSEILGDRLLLQVARDLSACLAPENVGSRFLSLLQSAPDQTLSAVFGTAEKPNSRRLLRDRLGGPRPERYGKLLSEGRSLSEAWGLADLLYKLFWQPIQWLGLVGKAESRHPICLLLVRIGPCKPIGRPQPLAQVTEGHQQATRFRMVSPEEPTRVGGSQSKLVTGRPITRSLEWTFSTARRRQFRAPFRSLLDVTETYRR